jgi:hypothetical protein|tara:strand:- start:1388 stop:1570 length:183 start_codon:yes stop_codon:yes gene_type:complete
MSYKIEKPKFDEPMKLFWHRVSNLHKMYESAKDPDFKRMWKDKLQELMKDLKKLDKRELN